VLVPTSLTKSTFSFLKMMTYFFSSTFLILNLFLVSVVFLSVTLILATSVSFQLFGRGGGPFEPFATTVSFDISISSSSSLPSSISSFRSSRDGRYNG